MTEAEDGLDLLGGGGEQDGLGQDADVGQGVGVVGVELFVRSDEAPGAYDLAKFVEEMRVHCDEREG